jgi:hypothetical protein
MALQQYVPYSQPASTTTANLLAGNPLEYWGKAGVLTIYGSADLAAAADTMSLSYFGGADPGAVLIPPGSRVPQASTAGAVKNNENFLGQFAIPANSRLVLAIVSSATVGTHTGQIQLVAS